MQLMPHQSRKNKAQIVQEHIDTGKNKLLINWPKPRTCKLLTNYAHLTLFKLISGTPIFKSHIIYTNS